MFAATSILSMTGGDTLEDQVNSNSEIVLMEAELISACLELCSILHNEFIFNPPCQTLEETIRKKMKFMQTEGLLRFQSVRAHLIFSLLTALHVSYFAVSNENYLDYSTLPMLMIVTKSCSTDIIVSFTLAIVHIARLVWNF